jgi:hypothetical protein
MDLELFSYHLSRSIPGHYNYWLYTYILRNTLFQVGEWLSFTPVYDETWRDNANISYWYMYMYSTLLRRIYMKFRTKPPSSGNCSESDSQRGYIDIILTYSDIFCANLDLFRNCCPYRTRRMVSPTETLDPSLFESCPCRLAQNVAKTGRELSHKKNSPSRQVPDVTKLMTTLWLCQNSYWKWP